MLSRMGLGLGGLTRGSAKAYVFTNAEAAALVARFTTQPNGARKLLIDTLVGSLKSAGVWSKLDAFYMLAAADSQAARLNWIADQYNLTAVNSPTFEADRGYTGNASSSYLDTGFNPATASNPKFVLNSGHVGVYSRTDNSTSTYFDIGNANARLNARSSTANALRGALNDATNGNFGANPTSIGHFALNRSAAGARQGYGSGSLLGSDTVASTAVGNEAFSILRGSTVYSGRQIATGHFGQSLSGTEVGNLSAAITAYLQAVGAA